MFDYSHTGFVPRRARAVFAVYVALMIAVVCSPAWADQTGAIELEYTFDCPRVETIKVDGQAYDRVILPGAPNVGDIGHPALPCFGAHVLVPHRTDVAALEITAGDKISIGSGYSIEPVDRPYFLSSTEDLPPLRRDPAVYSLPTPIPAKRFEEIGIQYFHGYRILILRLNPVEYVPATGELSYYENISVRVTITPSERPARNLRSVPSDMREVVTKIDNPNAISTYKAAVKAGGRGYDMLILTPSSLVDAFIPLKEYHDTTGVLTEIHTLDLIGSIDPHSIREYIRQQYFDDGIQYVLLGGDDDLIPSLKLYVRSWEGEGAVTEYNMPADFYFSCLDGTFNYDGDAYWGEPTDGDGGGEIDMYPEIHVGRVSANTPQEVTNLVDKTLAYASSQGQYLEKVLLAGEQLTFGGWGEYGGYAMDEMVDYSDAHGFMTYAFPDDSYSIEKLYDYSIQPDNYWPAGEMIARINAGVHIIDHLGHSGPGYAMRTDTSMLRWQLTNTEYCFVYAEGCSAGQFDLTDCWAEYMTTKLPEGAFGCVANARLGLGSRSTRHPVHIFNREFWDAVYRADEAKPQIGRAISDARADHAYHVNDPGVRWTLYEITLFGDPAVAIKPVKSVAISYPDGLPERIAPDIPVSFTVMAAGIGEGIPVQASGQIYWAIDGGDMITVHMDEISPNLYEATLPGVPCGSSIEYLVSVDESSGGVFYSPDPSSPNVLSPIADSIILFEDDFETDKGWTISGGLWQRGIPTGQGGTDLQYPVPDPTQGCNGPSVFGYNLNGDYENNLGETHITGPAVDCSGWDNVFLKFCRWLGVERPIYDQARVMLSDDGVDWTQVWINHATIGDLEWEYMEYDISEIAAGQAAVYIRFVMGPTDGGLRYNGWNIDDVRLISYECETFVCGDANGDEDIDVSDAVYIINFVFKGGPTPDPLESGDADCDGAVNVADGVYIINYIFKGGPEPCCP